MDCTCFSDRNCVADFPEDRPLETELVKALKVIGDQTGQLVIENSTCINAIKIDRINASLVESSDHLFHDKVVKQGIIRKAVFYVNPQNELRYVEENIPFRLTFEIPGLQPNDRIEVQNHLMDISTDYHLSPAKNCFPGCLREVIAAHIRVVVSEWIQVEAFGWEE